jgi:hypothetical protein
MSGIAETFSNPYVLGGGALLGLVLLMSKKNASTADATGVSPSYSSAVAALNQSAIMAVTQQAQIAANVAIAKHQDDTTVKVATLATIKAFDDNRRVVANQQVISQQGIIQTMVSTQGAVEMDVFNNANRLALAQEQTIQSIHHDNANVQIAQQQAKAAKDAANSNLLGNIIKTAVSVGMAPFTGGASLIGLSSLSTGGGASGAAMPGLGTDLAGLY